MALGIHFLTLRPATLSPPYTTSNGFCCLSLRWHSVNCALSSDEEQKNNIKVSAYKTSQCLSTDEHWMREAERERERTRRFQGQAELLETGSVVDSFAKGGKPFVSWKCGQQRQEEVDEMQRDRNKVQGRVGITSQLPENGVEIISSMYDIRQMQSGIPSRVDQKEGEDNHITEKKKIFPRVTVLDRKYQNGYMERDVNYRTSSKQQLDGATTTCDLDITSKQEIKNAPEIQARGEPVTYSSSISKEADSKNVESIVLGALISDHYRSISSGTTHVKETPQMKLSERKTSQMVCMMEDILVVDNLAIAQVVIEKLRGDYKDFIHACDTEVSDINVKKESPVGHGNVICFSIYCGPDADFGNGKNCIWVDVLGTSSEIWHAFKDYFEDSTIRKVWHNFSFDKHVLANHGMKVSGFYADTMHLARLWHSGRKGSEGGYSLESLTSDINVMNGVHNWDADMITKKTSMKELFGVGKLKKDGTEGSLKAIPPVEELQRSPSLRERWICYSSGDALCTWRLWESLHEKLKAREWYCQNQKRGNMYDFYCTFWQPFGDVLAGMEAHGMLVDRDYLAEVEKVACKERATSISRFRKWAAKYCSNAQYINVTSDAQIRQLLFGGFQNVSKTRRFKIPNVDGYIEEGKKAPLKFRTIEISGIGVELPVETLTSSGLPAVSMQALKNLAGKVSVNCDEVEEEEDFIPGGCDAVLTSAGVEDSRKTEKKSEEDLTVYGKAYHAFNGGQDGKEACKAIAALCEISAIDTLISSFIQPLQGGDILGPDGRVHCSLNLNTETGRLSARRPNLQNQPALEKDRYKIRQAFIASPGNSLIVADYGQLELRLLAHLANCQSMLEAFSIGGDFHSRTAMNMYDHLRKAVERGDVLLEWEPKAGEESPPAPLLKDVYAAERRKAKMLNFSIAYGKTAMGLSKDWKVSLEEAQETVDLWYRDRREVRLWQEIQKRDALKNHCVYTILGRARHFPAVKSANNFSKGRIERAAINTPVQGSAADVAMLAMLEIARNTELKRLGWRLLLQVHDEMILEGPTDSAAYAKDLVVRSMSHPFNGKNILKVDLVVDAKYANSWYAAK